MGDERITSELPADSSPTSGGFWHVIHGGRELGPFSFPELARAAAAGEFEADDLVRETGGLWIKARDVALLQELLGGAPQEEASKRPPAPANTTNKAVVGPVTWVILLMGLILFLLDYGRDLLDWPLGFLLACCTWGLVFGVPAYLCFRNQKRTGLTVVATVFFLAAMLDVVGAAYSRYIVQSQLAKILHGAGGERLFPKEAPGEATREGERAGSRPALARDERADRANATPYYDRGQAWLREGDFDEAIQDFTEAIRLDPKYADAYSSRGNAWSIKWDYDKAIKDHDEAIRLNPSSALAYRNRGWAWLGKLDYDKAIRDYDEAIRLDPRNPVGYRDRGNAWQRKGDNLKAVQNYHTAIRLDPNDAHAYYSRGYAWSLKKDYEQAIRDYDQAIRLDPTQAIFFSFRGSACQAKKDYLRALRDYEEAVRLDPKIWACYTDLAMLLATCPDTKFRDGRRAVRMATKGCELSDWKRAPALEALAAAYAEAGSFGEAERYQRMALEDPLYQGPAGDPSRKRLELYKRKMPYREDR
jgi:tetratricopeptide (TPR) repeat protein